MGIRQDRKHKQASKLLHVTNHELHCVLHIRMEVSQESIAVSLPCPSCGSLDIYLPEDSKLTFHKDKHCSSMFAATQFTRAEWWNQPRCLNTEHVTSMHNGTFSGHKE